MNPHASPSFSEGRIDLRLRVAQGQVAGVDIRSSRPQVAQRLMAGRAPAEAADLAGLVFGLCGQAQRSAAQAACDAALALEPAATDTTRVAEELAREHAWRLLLDWPAQAGAAPDMSALLALRQAGPEALAPTLDDLLAQSLLGEPARAWLARDLEGLDAWSRAGATLPARLFAALGQGADTGISQAALLPPLDAWDDAMAAGLAGRALDDSAFCAAPDWWGAPAETGAIARAARHPMLSQWLRHRGRGLGARMLARLLELAALPAGLREGRADVMRAWRLEDGLGMAGVETSRGLLLHVARMEDDRVADYRILAPTEWNFHPRGPLAQALTGLRADAGLEARARLVAHSLDPCVAFGVEVVHA